MTFLIHVKTFLSQLSYPSEPQRKWEEEAVAMQWDRLLSLNCGENPVRTEVMEEKSQLKKETESFDSFRRLISCSLSQSESDGRKEEHRFPPDATMFVFFCHPCEWEPCLESWHRRHTTDSVPCHTNALSCSARDEKSEEGKKRHRGCERKSTRLQMMLSVWRTDNLCRVGRKLIPSADSTRCSCWKISNLRQSV